MAFLEPVKELLRRHYDALLLIPEDDGIIFTHAAREGNDQTRTGMTLAHLKQFRMHDFPLWPAEMVPHGNNGYALFSHNVEERDFMHQVFQPYAIKLEDRINKGLCTVAGQWAAWFLVPFFFYQMCGLMEVVQHTCEWFRSPDEPFMALQNMSLRVGGGFFESGKVFLQMLKEVHSEQRRARWASLTEEQRQEVSEQRRAWWASLTEEQREEVSEQRREQATEWWAAQSQEQLDLISEKHKVRWAKWTEEERHAIFQKAKTTREAWSEEEWQSFRDNIAAAKNAASPEIKAAIIEKYKATMAAKTDEERAERCRKISEARLNRTEEELAEARKKMAETNAAARTSEANSLRLQFEAGELTVEEKRNIIKNGKERRKYREEHPGTAVCTAMESLFEDVQAAMEAEEHPDNLAKLHCKQKAELLRKTLEQRAKFDEGLLSKEEEDQIIICGKARAKAREDEGREVFCPEAEELYRDVVQHRDRHREETNWSKKDQAAQALANKYGLEATEQMARFLRGELSEEEKTRIIINGNARKLRRKDNENYFRCAPLEELYEAVLAASDRVDVKEQRALNFEKARAARAQTAAQKAREDLLRLERGELSHKDKCRIKANGDARKKRRVEGDVLNEDVERLYQAVLQQQGGNRSSSSTGR